MNWAKTIWLRVMQHCACVVMQSHGELHNQRTYDHQKGETQTNGNICCES